MIAVLLAPIVLQAPAAPIALEGRPVQGGLVRGTAPPGTIGLTLDGKPVPLAPDGRFLLGFDRDQGPRATLVATLAGGGRLEQAVAVAPGQWKIERIGMARPSGGPTPEYKLLRDGEVARIEAARAASSDAAGWRQAFVWPAKGRMSGVFGSQRVYRGGVPAAFHGGLDIAAGAGATVVAPADGVVVLAGPPAFSLEGNLVILDHGLGLNSAFLHLSATLVSVGQHVRRGEPIGRVGMTGRATGPHLHWAVQWRGARIDPARLLAAAPSP